MPLTADDRTTITDLINLHGHLTDRGDFDGLSALFADDVTYDVTALGGTVMTGLSTIKQASLAMDETAHPVAHHVTNVVLRETAEGVVHALSKGFGVMVDGSVGSVTYEDTVERGRAGWRITRRIVRPRRRPLHP
ncbi:nuclear transport factor 2 family protein [Micromonospora zhanjiangensis]|uniref:Nuclear transport factor 2 family protein n=1 Tax=Micromonospora zhanjiangensis TaxID=1522057 RepID=A0ABV8KSX1_9ACTN